jgi:hypothetical protein
MNFRTVRWQAELTNLDAKLKFLVFTCIKSIERFERDQLQLPLSSFTDSFLSLSRLKNLL